MTGCSRTTSRRPRRSYAPSLKQQAGGGCSTCRARCCPAWGTGRRSEVVLWQKVLDHGRLADLLAREVPPEFRAPGTWMNDALRVRDDWESRLLRTVRWSPLY